MGEPTKAEVDAVGVAIDDEMGGPESFSGPDRDKVSRAAIAALDKARGECVPVDKLRAKMDELYGHKWTIRSREFMSWLAGWLDDKKPVVQTDRRKP